MPRYARGKSSTGIYHVITRGNRRSDIFFDEYDKLRFIDILKRKSEELDFFIYAYCLMDNHIHLLINELGSDISKIMGVINISYVRYFNTKYDKIGHLFQDRYKSEAVENEKYLFGVIRYIHQNPLKAAMVNSIDDYKWSSYKEYIDSTENRNRLCHVNEILGCFSNDNKNAILKFKDFHQLLTKDDYLDIPEKEKDEKDLIYSEADAEKFLEKFYFVNNITREELIKQRINERNLLYEAILYLKTNSVLSYSQISSLVGISRSTICRVK